MTTDPEIEAAARSLAICRLSRSATSWNVMLMPAKKAMVEDMMKLSGVQLREDAAMALHAAEVQRAVIGQVEAELEQSAAPREFLEVLVGHFVEMAGGLVTIHGNEIRRAGVQMITEADGDNNVTVTLRTVSAGVSREAMN